MAKILIVEDQFLEANNLQIILQRAGYDVCSIAHSVAMAQKIIEEEQPDMILLDIRLQGKLTGIDLAHTLNNSNIAFIFLSANADKKTLEEAKATKPNGFLVKPFREQDVPITLDVAWYLHRHKLNDRKNIDPVTLTTPAKLSGTFSNIIGSSQSLREILESVNKVGPSDTSVLILGESGTGKELIAKSVHLSSPRALRPFVVINCAALPSELIESELFGHEKGSFTGAYERKIGKFELADNGTVFLDEIGELPKHLQVKFLRVLQEKEIERIGGLPKKINVRIIAATNRDLEEEVAAGRFRLDLYYRLNVFPLTLPPLRERIDDIPILANYFMERLSGSMGKKVTSISAEVMQDLMNYNWPGNIRELEHIIECSILMASNQTLTEVRLPLPGKKHTSGELKVEYVKTFDENERDHIISVLNKCKGKIFGAGGAAEILGLPPSTLNSKIAKLGIKKDLLTETN